MFRKIILSGICAILTTFATQATSDTKTSNPPKGFPEEMERNFDKLLEDWAARREHKIDCDFLSESPVFFDDSVYLNRLYALPTRMELAYNSIVKRYIEMYADRRRGQVSYMLGKGVYYFPIFEDALIKEGLPIELKYLPVIESALNPIAKSRVGATGLWQFMPATGRMYNLEINSLVDERRDPHKATEAAVKYLKDMYKIYGDWNLVIAAYNCGPGNVNKAIRRSGGKKDYWDIYPYLPRETRGYVPAFIAATYIMSYHTEHNICPGEVDFPLLTDTVNVNKLVHFEQISDIVGISVEEIRKLNPQFQADIVPGGHKEYSIKLPFNNLMSFIDQADTIYAHRANELLTHQKTRTIATKGNVPSSGGHVTHRIKRGDTLGAIAMRYRVSINQLKSWNGMKSDRLKMGQVLKVSNYIAAAPKTKTKPLVEKEQVSELVAEDGVLKRTITTTKRTRSTYKVQRGDTWQGIANKTDVSIADIKKWNNINNNNLIAGKSFTIYKEESVEEFVEVPKPEKLVMPITVDMALSAVDSYIDGINTSEPITEIGMTNSPEIDASTGLDDGNVIYHKVLYGETLSQIAHKYGVAVKDVLSWNNITRETSKEATRLLIIQPSKDIDTHVVSSKDAESNTAQL